MRTPFQKDMEKQARFWLTQAIRDARHAQGFAACAHLQPERAADLNGLAERMKKNADENMRRAHDAVNALKEKSNYGN